MGENKLLLTADEILNTPDLPTKRVRVPEWKADVLIRCMTGRERDGFESWLLSARTDDGGPPNVRARFLSMTICNEEGGLLFTPAQIDALGDKSGAALERVFFEAQKYNRVTPADLAELQGNLDGDLSADSPLSSPAT